MSGQEGGRGYSNRWRSAMAYPVDLPSGNFVSSPIDKKTRSSVRRDGNMKWAGVCPSEQSNRRCKGPRRQQRTTAKTSSVELLTAVSCCDTIRGASGCRARSFVAAEVSPLHLQLGGSQSRLTSAATSRRFIDRLFGERGCARSVSRIILKLFSTV